MTRGSCVAGRHRSCSQRHLGSRRDDPELAADRVLSDQHQALSRIGCVAQTRDDGICWIASLWGSVLRASFPKPRSSILLVIAGEGAVPEIRHTAATPLDSRRTLRTSYRLRFLEVGPPHASLQIVMIMHLIPPGGPDAWPGRSSTTCRKVCRRAAELVWS